MSSSVSHNHTPIDFHKLAKRFNHSLGGTRGFKLPSNSANIFLMTTLVIFVFSISYSINTSQKSTETKAAPIPTSVPQPTPLLPLIVYNVTANTPSSSISAYPKTYSDIAIPAKIYTEGENKYSKSPNKSLIKKYIIDRVTKYYVYLDVLAENDIAVSNNTVPSFAEIEKQVPILEGRIKEQLITKADFGYITTWHDTLPGLDNLDEAKSKYKQDLNFKAKDLLTEYRNMFLEEEMRPEDILKKAKTDDRLEVFNDDSLLFNEIKKNYAKEDGFLLDKNYPGIPEAFDNFLFDQTPEIISPIFDIADANKGYIYIIVYPFKLEIKQYDSFKTLFDSKKTLFTFEE